MNAESKKTPLLELTWREDTVSYIRIVPFELEVANMLPFGENNA
jgi:hypothetical protein